MTSTPQARKRHRAAAARQALTLCEAGQPARPRTGPAARAALRAAGLPPLLATALRGRLHLTTIGPEADG